MIKLIGFKEATLTNDIAGCIRPTKNVEVIYPDDFFNKKYNNDDEFIVTVVRDLSLRSQIINELSKLNLKRATFIHPTAIIDSTATINSGTFIGPFSSVFCRAVVGQDCIIGPYSMVSHQVTIGNSSILNPGTIIAGTVTIGNNCTFGLRSTVLDQLNICDNTYIGGGSLVNKNIDNPGCYVGSPARRISREEDFVAIDKSKIK